MRYVDSVLDEDLDERLAQWSGRELPTASALTLRTGFYSVSALDIAQDDLTELLNRGGELLAVLGGNLLQVDLVALQAMLEICRRYPEKARVYVIAEPAFQNAKTYHVTHADGRSSAWVGSANFTRGGFVDNLEAAITLSSDEDDPHLLERVRTATVAAAQKPLAQELNDKLIEHLQKRVRESRLPFGRASLGPVSQLVDGYGQQLLDDMNASAMGDDRLLTIATGFPDLDDLLDGGLRPGTLTVVASSPGAGRSTLVLNMLTHAAFSNQVPAALFTFQSSAKDVLLRVLSADTGIDVARLRRGREMSDPDWTGTADRLGKLMDGPLYINAGPGPHLEGLCAAITAATLRQNATVVAVDPLGAVLARTFADNREREISEVVRRLKALAMELQVCMVVTAELGRNADHPGGRPNLTDLRDSGVIAHVADQVILLHNPDARESRYRSNVYADLIVAKNSHGRRGTVAIFPRLSISKFEPAARPSAPEPPRHTPTPAPTRPDLLTALPPSGHAPGQDEHHVAALSSSAKWRVRSTGSGTPTLIYLGRADPADDEWTALTARLQELTRIVTYERPGLAGGDPLTARVAKGLHSVSMAVRELDTLLWQGKVPTPYVLVASSIGCWIADQYAVEQPRKVTGMVLLDPVNLTPWPPSEHGRPDSGGNDDETGYLRRLDADSFAELARHAPTEPRRNVVISSSDGRWQRHPPAAVTAWNPDALTELDELWQGFQRDWVRRTNARHIVAETAGHLVHRDQPDLVADTVTAVVEAARTGKSLRLDPAAVASGGGRLERG